MYHFWISVGWLLCFLSLSQQFHRNGHKVCAAAITLILATLSGLIASKLLYILLFFQSSVSIYGWAAFVNTAPETFSVFGLMAGALIGAMLSSKLIKLRPGVIADSFAPSSALFLVFLRIAEKELGTIGVGHYIDPQSFFARFPFAVTNSYGEHLFALFYLEALIAFVCSMVTMVNTKKRPIGIKAESCYFYLALSQIFFESLRVRCMKWGFIRVEQLLCGILLLLIICHGIKKVREMSKQSYLPALITVFCITGVGLLEFALDKSNIPNWLCYAAMLVLLFIIGLTENKLISKRAVSHAESTTT